MNHVLASDVSNHRGMMASQSYGFFQLEGLPSITCAARSTDDLIPGVDVSISNMFESFYTESGVRPALRSKLCKLYSTTVGFA